MALQSVVHSIEEGPLARLIRIAGLTLLIITLFLVYLFVQFKGLSSEAAMDQAQIARQIAEGKGYTTKYIRPMAMWMLDNNGLAIPEGEFPEFYNPPLAPLITAVPLTLFKGALDMKPSEIVFSGDRLIAGLSMLFFFLSLPVWYQIGKRLFDTKLALVACSLILVTDLIWQFTLSGLPHMLMLLIFSLVCWATVLASEAEEEGQVGKTLLLLGGAGLGFGLLTLTHGLACWLFAGWLIYVLIFFKLRLPAFGVALALYIVAVAPWMVYMYSVCGNPFGLAIYTASLSGTSPETTILRALDPDLSGILSNLRGKLRGGFTSVGQNMFTYLGLNLAAILFFVSIMHPFKKRGTSNFRWALLAMWIGAVAGMMIFGVQSAVSINQLHVLFIPLFATYGMAFLLVLFTRLEFNYPLLRTIFTGFIIFLCAVPMLLNIFGGGGARVHWPPYIPPFISYLGSWFDDDEIVCSDMPWAVAWYAKQKSLLLPDTVRNFNRINDYRLLHEPVNGLYLTPVTGNLKLISDIYKGAYKEWAGLITRPPVVKGFALPVFTPLPIEGECILFADSARWARRASTSTPNSTTTSTPENE